MPKSTGAIKMHTYRWGIVLVVVVAATMETENS